MPPEEETGASVSTETQGAQAEQDNQNGSEETESTGKDAEVETHTTDRAAKGLPPSPRDKALDRAQRRIANMEKGFADLPNTIKAAMAEGLKEALASRGGSDDKEDFPEIDDDEPLTGRQLKELRRQMRAVEDRATKRAYQQLIDEQEQRRSAMDEAGEQEQEWLDSFDKGTPEHMKGQGRSVLDEYKRRMSRFRSLDRMNAADQQTLMEEQYEAAWDAVERRVRQGGKSPKKKSPDGTEVIKEGGSATGAQQDTGAPQLNEYGVPKGIGDAFRDLLG